MPIIVESDGAKNYLDPYTFWNFKGRVKTASTNQVYYLEVVNGQVVKGPTPVSGSEYDRLPAYAETAENQPITGEGKIAAAPKARPTMVFKPIPITKSIRGKPVSGRPLKPEELVGSRARWIVEGKEG